ncbi:immunity-related GTPase family, e4 isoform X1 [Silurus meridionalis]|nr:immunity-related GTPase family, e4 isoform X1 [Silurus meridionalis]
MASEDSDVKAAIKASGESDINNATKKALKMVDQLLNVTLHIAVIGESGTGKSTFINAYRGLNDDDEGAAKTGTTETTTEPRCFDHPTLPNVKIWDLPGIGTPTFTAKNYLKNVPLKKYDVFIIISSERRNCIENLKEFENVKVFLISSLDLQKFDFEKLIETLTSDLPENKQLALLQSAPVTSVAMLKKKVVMFEKAAWAAAICSGAIAIVPVPGLSLACDSSILVSFLTKCYFAFGLNDKSIQKLSERVNKPHLTSFINSNLIDALANKAALRLAASSVVEILCQFVPFVGSGAAAAISFKTTHAALNAGLKELENAALMLLREAGLE